MLKVSLLSTGSQGNSCIFDNGKTVICIDMGIKDKDWKEKAKKQGYEYEDIEALLITHAHNDHVATSANKFIQLNGNEKMYTTKVVANDISRKQMLTRFNLDEIKTLEWGFNKIGEFEIMPIKMEHYGLGPSRIRECIGFEINDLVNGKRILYASDTFSLSHVKVPADGYDLLMLEDNHDEEWSYMIYEMSSKTTADSAKYTRTKDHFSSQQLAMWLFENNKKDAPVIPLHESSRNKKPGKIKLMEGEYYNTFWGE